MNILRKLTPLEAAGILLFILILIIENTQVKYNDIMSPTRLDGHGARFFGFYHRICAMKHTNAQPMITGA